MSRRPAVRDLRRHALLLASCIVLATRAHADTITILANGAPVVNGWNFETRALAPIDACDANHTAHQPAAFSPNSNYLTFSSFQPYATPAGQQIANVVIDFLGGSDAGTGLSGFQAGVVGQAATSSITWNEDVLDCQWRFRNTAGGGGSGWSIFSLFPSWSDATVNGLQTRVRRAGAGDHDLRVNGARIVVFTIPQLPASPAGLSLSNVTTNSISMSWTPGGGGGAVANVQVERATSSPGNGYGVVATLAGNATSYTDPGLAERTTYFYRVRAFNSSGASGYSNEASVATLNTIHGLIFSIQPSNVGSGSVLNGSGTGVEVTGVDASNFVVPTFTGTVTVSLADGDCSAPLSGTVSKAAVNGVATFTDLVIDGSCSNQSLSATSPGIPVPSVASAAFAVMAGTGVGGATPPPLALASVRPNPASTRLQASFSLPGGEPATLELVDVSGRVVLRREVGLLGAGQHALELALPRPLGAGLYWLRLSRQGAARVTRVAVVR